jgi:3'5'-cyclic nucleotide phosphodiesterase
VSRNWRTFNFATSQLSILSVPYIIDLLLCQQRDHPGVPNAQLVQEKTMEAEKYKGKSVAEQNSLDKCWDLLMQPKYKILRETIYTTSKGLERFRSLLINVSSR